VHETAHDRQLVTIYKPLIWLAFTASEISFERF